MISLQWYRDKGQGQRAAEEMAARQEKQGNWPIAVLPCGDKQRAEECWWYLYKYYHVNAVTHIDEK